MFFNHLIFQSLLGCLFLIASGPVLLIYLELQEEQVNLLRLTILYLGQIVIWSAFIWFHIFLCQEYRKITPKSPRMNRRQKIYMFFAVLAILFPSWTVLAFWHFSGWPPPALIYLGISVGFLQVILIPMLDVAERMIRAVVR